MAKTKTDLQSPGISGSKLTKQSSRVLAALFCCTSPLALYAQELPTGGTVAAGDVVIGTPVGNQMTVTQTTDTAVVNWNSFDVGAGAGLHFDQPTTNSAVLNRVTGNTGTDIHGSLTADGVVHVVNPNGIFIGPDGSVQTGGGFVASTLNITDEDFISGNYTYSGNGQSARVDNAGAINIGRGGYAALLGGHVSNSGTVTVPVGRIGFASGERVTLDLSGDGFLQVAVPTNAQSADGEALITHSGRVSAEGGLIEMKAATARNAVRHAVNLSGIAEATSVSVRGGAIVLGGGAGGKVTVSGQVSTKARRATVVTAVPVSPRPIARPARGGDITVTGAEIVLNGATLDASGADGGGQIKVGGDFAGAGDLQRAKTVRADAASQLNADAIENGDGGRIVIWSDDLTEASAQFSARGGAIGGDGGFVEVSSANKLTYRGSTTTQAAQGDFGTLLLDPRSIIVGDDEGADVFVDTLLSDLGLGNVTLDTAEGSFFDSAPFDITIAADLAWSAETTLTLDADDNIAINASISAPNGGLDLIADGDNQAGNGQITTGAGGAINVARFLVSSGDWVQVGALPAFSATDFRIGPSGSFLRAAGGDGASSPYQITDVFGLQGIGSSPNLLQSDYVLANNINASGTTGWVDNTRFFGVGFKPIGDENEPFTGSFAGNGRTISGLFSQGNVDEGFVSGSGGLFGQVGNFASTGQEGNVSDVTLTGVNISNFQDLGGLVGINRGTISDVSVAGAVRNGYNIGGIAGDNFGVIRDSTVDVNVTANASDGFLFEIFAGGAIGFNSGNVTGVDALGNVSVGDGGGTFVTINAGGFVGQAGEDGSEEELNLTGPGSITNSTSQGAVTGTMTADTGGSDIASSLSIGGFAGSVATGPSIATSTSVGSVSASSSGDSIVAIGGFAGQLLDNGANGTGASNTWNIATSGQTTSPVGTGINGAIIDIETPLPIGPPIEGLPNPEDELPTEEELGQGEAAATLPAVEDAEDALAQVNVIAAGLNAQAVGCSAGSQDIGLVLDCLSDALGEFSAALDEIITDLPPELADVAQIVRDAQLQVSAARTRAVARLATASSDAERRAIRQDAVNEARAAITTASQEIRKAIDLVRVADPELASTRRETIVTVAAAVQNSEIGLSRAVGL